MQVVVSHSWAKPALLNMISFLVSDNIRADVDYKFTFLYNRRALGEMVAGERMYIEIHLLKIQKLKLHYGIILFYK